MNKAVKVLAILIVGFFTLVILGIALIKFELDFAVHTKATKDSPDGSMKLELQSVGEPLFFSSADGRLVLKKGLRKIETVPFTLADDGGSIREDIWQVYFEHDYVTVIISGSEQDDEYIRIWYDGTSSSERKPRKETKKENKEEKITSQKQYTQTPKPLEPSRQTIEQVEEKYAYMEAEQKIDDGYYAIYQEFFADQNDSFIKDYDAKGNTRVIFHEDKEKVEFLVYDRDSKNGACALYVYYRSDKMDDGSWSPTEATILTMYAYEYDTHEVVDSEKSTWSDLGTERYRTLTGE